MEEITYFQATESDVQLLIDYRIAFLAGIHGTPDVQTENTLRATLQPYFEQALRNSTYISWYARCGEEIAGIGGIVIRQRSGTFKYPNGLEGYIMSIYTPEKFRRKGIATAITNKLVETAIAMGVGIFELHATAEGEGVYEACGFKVHGQKTYRKYV